MKKQKEHLKNTLKRWVSKSKFAVNYLIAYYRHYMLSNKVTGRLIRQHIKEQYQVRINSANNTCYEQGVCKACGCSLPIYHLANSSCYDDCYPKMLSAYAWDNLKKGGIFLERCCDTGSVTIAWRLVTTNPISEKIWYKRFEKSDYVIGADFVTDNLKQTISKAHKNSIEILTS